MRASEFITEGQAYPIICVDVQPEYSGINDGVEDGLFTEIIQFVNNQTGPVLMLVNAERSGASGDTISDIKQYWEDTICPEEDRMSYDEEADEYTENENCPTINWSRFQVIDKGYGYLRSWMDGDISPAAIIRVIRAMYQYKISDSRELFDIAPELLPNIVGDEWKNWMREDSISVNWISVAQLKKFSGAYIVGGGRSECLREVEILMNAFNIRYKRIDSLVYGE